MSIPHKAQPRISQLELDLARVEDPGVGISDVLEKQVFQVVHAVQRSFDGCPQRLAERGWAAQLVTEQKVANKQSKSFVTSDCFACEM